MDEFDLLARARPVDPPAPRTVAHAREALLRLAGERPAAERPVAVPARRFRLRTRVLVPVAAGALALLSVGMAALYGRTEAPVVPAVLGPVGTSAEETAARKFLLTASEQTLHGSAERRGAYWVSVHEQGQLIEVGRPGRRYAVMSRTTETWWSPVVPGKDAVMISQWAGAAPATARDRAAWKQDGSPSGWVKDVPPGCAPDPNDRWTAAPGRATGVRREPPFFDVLGTPLSAEEVRTLPSEPAALEDWLMKIVTEQGLGGGSQADIGKAAFSGLINLLFQTPAPAPVRAAAYQVMAQIPGVRSLGAATDARGRTGVAVSISRNDTAAEQRADPGGPVEVRLLFDPESGRTLSMETYLTRPADYLSWVPAGALFNYNLLAEQRWTDAGPPAMDYAGEGGVRQQAC